MKLTAKQASARSAIGEWLEDPHAQQVFYLGGAAGSGKSTIIEAAMDDVDENDVAYVAPTGKAALVMRRKGCPNAQTIHQAIYRPAGDPPSPAQIEQHRAEITRLSTFNDPASRLAVERLKEQLHRFELDAQRTGPRFSLNIDSHIKRKRVVVCDEASMVDRFMGRDLESFNTKILAVGDPNQLPPIYGEPYFMSRAPDAYLDEIHRQALDSPILRLADLARRGQSLPIGQTGPGVDVRRHGDPSLADRARQAEMILVGRNKTRHASNAKIRRLLGRGDEPAPVPGDRMICRRNNHLEGLLNGSSWTVTRCIPNLEKMTAFLEARSLEGDEGSVECSSWLHHFWAREKELTSFARLDHNEFAYGWAQTVHTSQGSQYDDVLLFDESRQFPKDRNKHLYTAITRAAKTLTVVV